MTKEVKIPMIVGVMLYGIVLMIDLLSVIFQKSVFESMNAPDEILNLEKSVFPPGFVNIIIVMIMLVAFLLIMFRYKGSSRRNVGIAMIVIYCITGIISPYINMIETIITTKQQGARELSAITTLSTFSNLVTSPFATVSTVLVLIAIGRYGISKTQQNDDTISNGLTAEIKEGQENDESIH